MAVTEQAPPRQPASATSNTSLIPRTTTLITSPECPPTLTDAYLTLRTNLDFALLGTPGATLIGAPVEGSVSAETAAVIANLAIATAASGDTVLVVDCNLHEPSLHTAFGLSNEHGLRALLTQMWADDDSISQPSVLPNLRVITAGQARPGALSALATNELAETVMRLKNLADRLILLGPPLLSYTETLMLCPYVDGLFVIVRRKVRGVRV